MLVVALLPWTSATRAWDACMLSDSPGGWYAAVALSLRVHEALLNSVHTALLTLQLACLVGSGVCLIQLEPSETTCTGPGIYTTWTLRIRTRQRGAPESDSLEDAGVDASGLARPREDVGMGRA